MLQFHWFPFLSSVVFFFSSCSLASFRPRGVSLSRKIFYDPTQPFTCLDGSQSLPFHFVNDDFCDCTDGTDEPGTSACSQGIFSCLNHGHLSINLPSSRVNDGICDCCDSSDEYRSSTDCFNNCKELGTKAVARALILRDQWARGHEERESYVQTAAEKKAHYQALLEELLKQEQEAMKVKNEKQDEKENAENRENQILAKDKEVRKEIMKRNQQLEKVFRRLDTDNDGKLTVAEVQSFEKFDYDNDGKVSEKEALFYLQRQEYLNLDGFLASTNIRTAFTLFETDSIAVKDAASSELPSESTSNNIGMSEKDSILKNAAETRKSYADADKLYRDIQAEIWRVRRKLRGDWGPDDAFLALESKCFELIERQHLFTLCPFDKIVLKHRSSHQETLLGLWDDWGGEGDLYSLMTFSRGAACPHGPNRASQVRVVCGGENRLLSSAESSPCTHLLEWATPAACQNLPSDVRTILFTHSRLVEPGWSEIDNNGSLHGFQSDA